MKTTFIEKVNNVIVKLYDSYLDIKSDLQKLADEKENDMKKRKTKHDFGFECLKNTKIQRIPISFQTEEDAFVWVMEIYNNSKVGEVFFPYYIQNEFGVDINEPLTLINLRLCERFVAKQNGEYIMECDVFGNDLLESLNNKSLIDNVLRFSYSNERTKALREITDNLFERIFIKFPDNEMMAHPFSCIDSIITNSELWKIVSEMDDMMLDINFKPNIDEYSDFGVNTNNFKGITNHIVDEFVNEIARIAVNFKTIPYFLRTLALPKGNLENFNSIMDRNLDKIKIKEKK